ncbi:hypothetical protein BGZ61DRAFT_510432 [Ilyonectria robusta]|uniref:uncharacterized protein n=1 Tax=Ilyonectria robusta TaxID=1079257 RepID=UPI001E8E6885|nr:uncharacterized protein BGZ61DRAFT_510432 [Ilyonectria robusta]KAH8661041.1 hypothetical protein BGZ61DRAFT_510432 [Ilyonectria robusta]
MQLSIVTLLSLAAGLAYADLHKAAVCVSDRKSSPVGGTAWSVSYNWQTSYEILPDATKCACENRNTGNKQWDQCPDCTFDGLACNSANKHIGGDEMNYYCTKQCGAQGSEAD